MKTLQIRKKSGKFRTVVCPDREQKQTLRNILGHLNRKSEKICSDSVHGFMRGRSPITAAMSHIGYPYTISMDLTDFFDSVTEEKVKNLLSKKELEVVLVDPQDGRGRRAMQGLPTSPAVANIAAAELDKIIIKFFDKRKVQVVYTRYADDLTFSFNDPETKALILSEIPKVVSRTGFKINPSKTRYMPAKAGRRVICGVSVGEKDVQATKSVRRKLRAAKHHVLNKEGEDKKKAAYAVNGLQAWVSMRIPVALEEIQKRDSGLDVVTKLTYLWGLGKNIPKKYARANITECLKDSYADGLMITSDPAYILGMSAYTSGWTSCMAPHKSHFKGVKFWLFSTSKVAALLSEKTKVFAGVERRSMRARCMLHPLRNGQFAYDRIYGDEQSASELNSRLQALGYLRISDNSIPRGTQLVGNIPQFRMPYFDNLKAHRMLDNGKKVIVLEKR